MSQKVTAFLDSDVVISSVLSKKGAASLLMEISAVQKIISDISQQEITLVARRMGLEDSIVTRIIRKNKIVKLRDSIKIIKSKYKNFVYDINDAHIVAGAMISRSRFLVTYNIKDYNTEKLKRHFDIIVLTPALLLQYLRSQK